MLWKSDRDNGVPGVELPDALARKYPRAGETWRGTGSFRRQRCRSTRAPAFAAATMFMTPHSSVRFSVQLRKPASTNQLRPIYTAPLLRSPPAAAGYDIRTVQELLGHNDVKTTMIYTHVLRVGGAGVRSPLDVTGTSDSPLPSVPQVRQVNANYGAFTQGV